MVPVALLTDIDNTLYDWAAFFAPSFRALIHALSRELALSEDQLFEECKTVFGQHESLDYPFLIQELESVRYLGPGRISELIDTGRGAFLSVQKKRLQPYPGVIETLKWLKEQDVIVIGVTNSPTYRAQQRLWDLHLDKLMTGIVSWEGPSVPVDDPATAGYLKGGTTRKLSRLQHVWTIPLEQCKPNLHHYRRALEVARSAPSQAWAIGDSLSKDLEPAAKLGMRTIWARYGSGYDPDDKNMATLLRITHWDSQRIHSTYDKNGFIPSAIVDEFRELRNIIPARYPRLL